MLRPEYLRQHALSKATGNSQPVFIGLPGQFLAFRERDRHAAFRFNEQFCLGEEPGEQHAVPMLVSTFRGKPADGLRPAPIALVAKLVTMSPEAIAQRLSRQIQSAKGRCW